jgi:hypothetical protein
VKENDTGTDGDIGKGLIFGKSGVMRRFRFRRLTAAHVRCSSSSSRKTPVALRSCQITFDFSPCCGSSVTIRHGQSPHERSLFA